MTYEMSIRQILQAAESRWGAIADRWPDLAPAVSLQRKLVARSLDLGEDLDRRDPIKLNLQPEHIVRKLAERTPILAGTPIEIDGAAVHSFVLGFCEDLAEGEASGPARRLRARLADGDIDVGSLIGASLGRQQEAIRVKAHHLGVAPDLLWLVAELAAGPIAHRLQRTLLVELPATDEPIRDALSVWDEGYCPACGSWPAFAECLDHDQARRTFRCSFCASQWMAGTRRCIYCRETGDSFVTAAVDPEDVSRRLELCRQCGGYLKCVDHARPTPRDLLAVEDLGTTDLDMGAADRGYRRPAMRVFPTANDPCHPGDL